MWPNKKNNPREQQESIEQWLAQEEALLDGPSAVEPEVDDGPTTSYSDDQSLAEDSEEGRIHSRMSHPAEKNTVHGKEALCPISAIPDSFRSIFPFRSFNAVQSRCFDDTYHSDKNLVVSAPTGSGKTVLMELAMLRAIQKGQGESKMIYMAPTKSLCSERAHDWEQKFQPLGIICKEFTGDTDYAAVDEIQKSTIIVTTPEKWDSLTRRWIDHKYLMQLITLFLIDEVHILNEKRGAVLEACVSRMKTMNHAMRYLAVSATVPNLGDIATWLNAKALSFSEEYRPVRLERFVYGIPFSGDNMFVFEKRLDWKLLEMIERHSHNKPVLIFCSTRKSTQSSCDALLKMMERRGVQSLVPRSVDSVTFKDKKLPIYTKKGIGFHHAGLELDDRRTIEQLFLQKKIRVVATTSTLAVGVNLPAHLVIIKSTKGYQNGRLVDYSDIDLLQMIGRAGRPGLDDSGCAVILTTVNMEVRYRNLVSGSNNLESSLHKNLVEHLMSEICLGTIHNVNSSVQWLQSTFLHVRVQRNPSFYQLSETLSLSDVSADNILQEICMKHIDMLVENGLVAQDTKNESQLSATPYGTAMDRYYIKLQTAVRIIRMERCLSIRDVLDLVSQAEEFTSLRYGSGEKPFLNSIRQDSNIRFPLSDKVSSVADKVFLVIQCNLGEISLHDPTIGNQLSLESFSIMQSAIRVCKFIIDCSAHAGDARLLKHALELYQSLQAKIWPTSPFILRQIDGIGPQMAKTLAQAHIKSFDQLRQCDPQRVEMILRRNPPFGNQIREAAERIPRFDLDVKQLRSRQTRGQVQVTVQVHLGILNAKVKQARFGKGSFIQFWADTGDHLLLDYRRMPYGRGQRVNHGSLSFVSVQRLHKNPQDFYLRIEATGPCTKVICHLQCEDYGILAIDEERDSQRVQKWASTL